MYNDVAHLSVIRRELDRCNNKVGHLGCIGKEFTEMFKRKAWLMFIPISYKLLIGKHIHLL